MRRLGSGVPEPKHDAGWQRKHIERFEDHFFLAARPQRDDPAPTGRNLANLFPSPDGCVYSSGNYHSERIYAARFRIVDASALLTPLRLMIEDTAWLNLRWLKKSR